MGIDYERDARNNWWSDTLAIAGQNHTQDACDSKGFNTIATASVSLVGLITSETLAIAPIAPASVPLVGNDYERGRSQ